MKALIFRHMLYVTVCLYSPSPAFSQFQQHNWPLNQLSNNSFQWGGRDQYLLSKIKYSDRNFQNVLFNHIDNNSNVPIGTEGLPANAYRPFLASRSISVLRAGPNGVYNWIRISGSATCYAKDLETDSRENFIVLADNNGNTWDTAYHYPLLSNYTDSTQLLLFKTDTTGKLAWYKFYGGSGAEYARCLKRTKDGNFLVLASTQSGDGDVQNYQGGKDIWLLKINSVTGNIIWQKTFGSPLDEVPSDMEILADESIVISGTADVSTFFPSTRSNTNAFLLKLNSNGTVIWKRTFGGSGEDLIRNFIPVNDGGYACIGTTNSVDGDMPGGFGGTDVFVSKHTADGNLQWIKMYGNSDNDRAGDIVYSSCDSTIFASYAKQFNNNINYPPYPGFIQSTGVEIGIHNSGTPFHYHENNFAFPASGVLYNEGFTFSMAPNNRGGFLGASITHKDWTPGDVGYGYLYTRSFDFIEYGLPLQVNYLDTTLCSGGTAWGHVVYRDTTITDSLRNGCNIDTALNRYTYHVVNNNDITVNSETFLCPGQLYDGNPVYASFYDQKILTEYNLCGTRRIIKNIHVIVSDLFLNVVRRITISPGQSVTLTPQTNGVVTWQSSNTLSCLQCQSTLATPLQTTVYYLRSEKPGCTLRDSVKVVLLDMHFFVPSAFTPNADRLNETFNALASGISEYDMRIFNRYGQLIFRTNSLLNGWDGKYLDVAQPGGAYVYMIYYKDKDGINQMVRGSFMLIR